MPKQPTKKQQQVQQNKKALIEALEKSLGVVTTACKAVSLDRTTHYRYLQDDKDYAAAVKDIEEVAVDFVESKLHSQINKGDTTACIFYLKTKGKHRGYIEKQEIDHSGGVQVTFREVDGNSN
jgi:hypothetical protein